MQNISPEGLAQMLTAAGFTESRPVMGCSEEDIHDLESRFSVSLPDSYKGFLKVMGRQAGISSTMVPGDIRWNMPTLTQWAS